MAHLKLFFPGLGNSNGVCQLLTAHSALASMTYHTQDQNSEMTQDQNKNMCETFKHMSYRWRKLNRNSSIILPKIRQKVQHLGCVSDVQSSDFWTSDNKDSRFIHALQLDDEQYRFCDIETVKSQKWSTGSRKNSQLSDTDSLECQSVIISIA